MRFRTRSHGEAIAGALERGITEDAFFRMMLSPADARDNETAFFIMTFKYLDWMVGKGGYEQYRRKRTERAMIYAHGVLEKYPHLKRVTGIAREPPKQGLGLSEDLIYAEQNNWTDDERQRIAFEVQADCSAKAMEWVVSPERFTFMKIASINVNHKIYKTQTYPYIGTIFHVLQLLSIFVWAFGSVVV